MPYSAEYQRIGYQATPLDRESPEGKTITINRVEPSVSSKKVVNCAEELVSGNPRYILQIDELNVLYHLIRQV